jgi:hypothetical protein
MPTAVEVGRGLGGNAKSIHRQYPALEGASVALMTGLHLLCAVPASGDRPHELYPILLLQEIRDEFLMGYALVAGGRSEAGYASLRRAAEFAFYLAKIAADLERADIWLSQLTDESAGRTFRRQMRIPDAFVGSEYTMVQPLLIDFEMFSDRGSHANFESVYQRWRNVGELRVSKRFLRPFFESPKDVLLRATTVVIFGFRLLTALRALLDRLKSSSPDAVTIQESDWSRIMDEVSRQVSALCDELGIERDHQKDTEQVERLINEVKARRGGRV